MRRDKNAPALLELIGKAQVTTPVRAMPARPAAPAPPALAAPSVPRAAPAPSASTGASESKGGDWFSPGRSIRVPVGYLIPLVLLAAALLVGAYATGYQARKAEDRRVQSAAAAREMMGLVDPLNEPPPPQTRRAAETPTRSTAVPVTQSPSRTASTSGTQPRRTEAPSALPTQPAKQGGVLTVTGKGDDPRQPGLNYLIAATLPPDEALKAANFLNSRGLEIAVVPADNPSLRWVVVLQGVAAKDLGGSAARGLEQRLQVLGREYRQVLKGPTVFNDPWWKKHTK